MGSLTTFIPEPWGDELFISVTGVLVIALTTLGLAVPAATQVTPWTELYRVPIPEELPAHPRVFCTAADLDRIRADYAAGDAYTRVCVDAIVSEASAYLDADHTGGQPTAADAARAATLAQAWALTGEEPFGRRALEVLSWFADVCPHLETTRAHGRFTDSTLSEGPVAVRLAMAWDLMAAAPFVTEADRRHIEDDLLRILGWECGHACNHMDSSNWRSWALAIVASCGFAIGDRALIDEAINGVWDPERRRYLYGIVQQLTHSVFADGIHWERSMGYQYYTMSALMYVLVAAEHSGIDLWHAELPGILEPFEGGARHDEFGPPGPRTVRALLDAPFYYAFPDLSFARINDSGMRSLAYNPIYELAWERYRDPKYAFLISRARGRDRDAPAWWRVWRARGAPEAEPAQEAHSGRTAWRLRTSAGDRVALVQEVRAPADRALIVSGRVRALAMDGASAHIRCNTGEGATFTDRVTEPGPWREVRCRVDPAPAAAAGQMRQVRLHVFLEGGAGEVLWDDLSAVVEGDTTNLIRNPGLEDVGSDGRRTDFWSLVHSPADVPAGHFSLVEDATIGLVGRNENGSTLFPAGGFTILRANPTDPRAPAVNFTWGPYGSGHDHPDRLGIVVYGQGRIVCPDAGSWGYDNPMHLTWANQTIAHNTLTVDEVSQYPQGSSNSIWASEREHEVTGVLRRYQSDDHLRLVRVTCDTAYAGVLMDRTLILADRYLLDVFRATSDEEHTYDLALHGVGEITTDFATEAAPQGWLSARGYSHLTGVRRSPAPDLLRARFHDADGGTLVLQRPPMGATAITAADPVRRGEAPTSVLISRCQGSAATWVTVVEPYTGAPTVTGLQVERTAEGVGITVTHAEGAERYEVADDPDGAVIRSPE